MKSVTTCLALAVLSMFQICAAGDPPSDGFPFVLPKVKPDRPMSAAMDRLYDAYSAPRPEDNELYSLFKYTELKGFDYNNHDGTISRRDPSKVIFANGKYYVWYTHRHTPVSPKGAKNSTDTIPSSDWDLADIWYATSEDGFTWTEQGVAVPRPPKPQVGWRSVTTTDILVWKGKYYLYYQGFMEASGTRGEPVQRLSPVLWRRSEPVLEMGVGSTTRILHPRQPTQGTIVPIPLECPRHDLLWWLICHHHHADRKLQRRT